MVRDRHRGGGPNTLRTGRLEAFSDGVFAIAITLLVLELGVPASGHNLLRALADQWPEYLAYIVSFASVGAMWVTHSAITDHIDRADGILIRLNLAFLLVVSFLPFPTKLVAAYVGDGAAERVAVSVYGLTLLAASGLAALLWRYVVAERLVHPDIDDEEIEETTARLTPSLVFYVVMLALGLVVPIAAVFGYLAIAVYLLIPFGMLRHRRP